MRLSLLLRDKAKRLRKKDLIQLIKEVLVAYQVEGWLQLSLSLVDRAEMRNLNYRYRNENRITDVLSFPLEKDLGPDGVVRLGDVVVCWPVAVEQAKKKGVTVRTEVDFLIKHGMLHLLGIHH